MSLGRRNVRPFLKHVISFCPYHGPLRTHDSHFADEYLETRRSQMTVVIMTQPVGGRGGVLEPWSSDTYVLSHWMEWGKAGEKAQSGGR